MAAKPRRAFPEVLARVGDGPDATPLRVCGREAETLVRLVENGTRGVRAYDFAGGPPYRLPAYVHRLRQAGLHIETRREEHGEGLWHGRFHLLSPVEIVAVSGDKTGEPNA